ncbi:hypothetical protein BOX15_Mlig030057g1 [Macrostomum lignano]|uniref:Uncharacterized protein n=1 Tax=Macrostomum lignano TaxID=282301 RepID=A0A267DGZ9_9PLAT|nr:hypothetical protein BOX15_Mlig030057g3 [Macrostomum lignano]PAA60624.1 hypothetical protein BOX15_Mlig030057g2 [Macrostomum lignano]PAA68964.1 hypothetical protein BOX15_Mlig030057g1 [Macrostomum lignano]
MAIGEKNQTTPVSQPSTNRTGMDLIMVLFTIFTVLNLLMIILVSAMLIQKRRLQHRRKLASQNGDQIGSYKLRTRSTPKMPKVESKIPIAEIKNQSMDNVDNTVSEDYFIDSINRTASKMGNY